MEITRTLGLPVGTVAPDFELPRESNDLVRLSSLIGERPVLLAFYSADFGMMCSVEVKAFKQYYERFRRLCTLLPISTNTTYSHAAYRAALDLPFSLLSDNDTRVCTLYNLMPDRSDDAYGYLEGGSSYRAVFIIDRKGIIRYSWAPENPSLEPDYDELLEFLEMLAKEK
ncbi:MAG: redoxin domain-containing protein [Methanomassiliicoccales archaeon]|jgi:peroxiredoxin Q/BCP